MGGKRAASAGDKHQHIQGEISDYDSDFDEEYFARTYRPLSNLPTPPLSSQNSSGEQSAVEVEHGELLLPTFFGPAVHLVNLLPPAASLATPSVSLVQAILSRADLPMHTIALAVCIMDSLNSRFSRQWRLSCPLSPDGLGLDTTEQQHHMLGSSKRHTLPAATGNRHSLVFSPQLHIDSVCPELIVLSALVIAAKFTVDSQERTEWYSSAWGRNLWTCEQINATERCIMENLGYRILPLTDPEILEDALSDMDRAGAAASMSSNSETTTTMKKAGHKRAMPNGLSNGRDDTHLRSKSYGKPTVSDSGLPLTPTETPSVLSFFKVQ